MATNTISETVSVDIVRDAEIAFANARAANVSADEEFAKARAITAAAKGRIAKPAIDDDPRDLILALHAGNAGEEIADLSRQIAEGQVIAAHVALKAAIDVSLTPAFNEVVAARIAACEAADAAREALAVAQHEFDKQTQRLYALRGAGKSGIPNIAELAGRVAVPSTPWREIHSASDEITFWPGIAA